MTSFPAAVSELLARLDAEAAAGVRDADIDDAIAAARAAWGQLDEQGKEQARDLAAELGVKVKARPSLWSDDDFALMEELYAEGSEDDDGRFAVEGDVPLLGGDSAPQQTFDGPVDPDALLAHMGLDSYRPGQREAVQAALEGRDQLIVMPTGGGKSLCYQLPGLATPGLTVVVSPLIALMADQHRRLAEHGHPAVMIASGMAEDDVRAAFRALRSGSARIVFCSPERFASAAFLNVVAERGVDLFVVDEAHCLAEWGHDFRPDYLRLPGVIERLGRPPVMAATATATEAVAEEIVTRLGLHDPHIVRSGFDRPNLSFDVLAFEGKGSLNAKHTVLVQGLAAPDSLPAIVYCGTRKDCELFTATLKQAGHRAAFYHAGLGAQDRARVQARFLSGDLDVIVATNAFGMGVDKADVRSVYHVGIPSSVEAYYQEAGRGGRDGARARAVLLAARADLGRLIRFNQEREIDPASVQAYHRRLLGRSSGGVLEMDAPDRDDERLSLAIVERAGAARLEPLGGRRLRVTLAQSLDAQTVRKVCGVSKDRGWKAYKAIEAYAFGRSCRRRTLLTHFGDHSAPEPLGRCCDVCDPQTGLPDPAQAAAQAARTSRASSSRGAAKSPVPADLDVDPRLLDALSTWRRQAAGDKPAYTVANNATLQMIAHTKPATKAELGQIKGVGPAFLDRHGDQVLQIVAAA